jgi:hypothetical protein
MAVYVKLERALKEDKSDRSWLGLLGHLVHAVALIDRTY